MEPFRANVLLCRCNRNYHNPTKAQALDVETPESSSREGCTLGVWEERKLREAETGSSGLSYSDDVRAYPYCSIILTRCDRRSRPQGVEQVPWSNAMVGISEEENKVRTVHYSRESNKAAWHRVAGKSLHETFDAILGVGAIP